MRQPEDAVRAVRTTVIARFHEDRTFHELPSLHVQYIKESPEPFSAEYSGIVNDVLSISRFIVLGKVAI